MKIHQVKTRLVNSYVVEYPDRLFVMDVAGRCDLHVLGFVEKGLKRDIKDIELVICSHDDFDHIGGVATLAKLCDAAIGMPLASGSVMDKIVNDPSGSVFRIATAFREAFRFRAWNMYMNPLRILKAGKQPTVSKKSQHKASKQDMFATGVKPDYRLVGSDTLPGFDDWLVVHTPGHSWDSCCFYHADSKSLLSGDTLLGSGKMGRLVTPAIYSNPFQMQGTLHKLRSMAIQSVYPGHGSVIEGDQLIENVRFI